MMDSRSFFLCIIISTAGLDTISLVEGYVAGAPPESCDTMLPIHLGSGFDDCSVANLCPTVSIEGVETIDNTFQYNCSQNYTITMRGGTSSLRGFLVEFRNFSDSSTFDGNLSHVGEFFIRSGYEDSTRLECEGHGVTQSKINTAGVTSFIWLSPGIGRQETFQMWYTIVTSPSAYFRPRKDIVGVPSEMSCTCTNDSFIYVTQTTPRYHAICVRCPENGTFENTPEGRTCICPKNTYFVMYQVGSTYLSECLECPANSMSEKGLSEICPCEEGFGRNQTDNASLPCDGCFMTPPTEITVISSQRPKIGITWEAPANSERWSILYRVTVSDGTSNVTQVTDSTVAMTALDNLILQSNYTLYVTAFTTTGCETGPDSVDITVTERCPDTPPNITNVVASAESVQLEYTPPYTDDPLIEESDLRYAVYLKCGFESNFTLVEDGIRNTTYNISGLLEVTECTAMLVAYSNDCSRELGGRFSDSVVFTTGLLECFTTPPTGLMVITSQRPDIEITWEAPANSERWSVLYRVTVSDRTGDVIAVNGSNETTATIQNLTVFASYSLHVTAFTETGCVTGPTSVGITVMERCPDTPPNITNVVVSAESVQLEYTPPHTEDPLIEESDFRYAVYRKCSFDSNTSLVEDGIQNTTYIIYDLQEVTECTATVVAYSKDCPIIFRDMYSVSTTFTTEALECFTTPPTNITVISSQRPDIEITWEAPANTERRTVLYRVTVSDGTSNETAVDSTDVTMATIPNLDVLTNYTLYVTAFTATGCVTGPTSVDITVMERCPDTPPNITNVVVSAESAQLEYTPPYTEDPLIEESDFRYAVYLRCGFDSDFILLEDGTPATTYTILGLQEVTECTAMLVAYSNDCPRIFGGQYSINTNFTTDALECFTTPPTNITVISSQRPEIEITWEAPANTERRTVLYRVTVSDGTSNVTEDDSIDVTVAVLPNLDVLTNYTLYVTAFTTTGCETGPDSVDITVMERCPDTPPNIINVVVSAESVQLEYTPPSTEDPLIKVSDFRYAAYRKCSSDSDFILVEDGIWDTTYVISGLPEVTECTAMLVAYSNDCRLMLGGQFSTNTSFTTTSSVCLGENKTTLGISLTWPQIPAGETSVISCPDTDRNATRDCSAEGVWEQPYVRECFTCPLEINTTSGVNLTWPLTPAGETAVQPCPDTDRSATRICSAEGVWEQPYIRECLTCPREANTTLGSGVTLTWPSTIAGETSVISCPDGDGNAIRNCTVEAVWEQPYVDNCICTEETKTTSGITLTWFLTPAGGTSVISCPDTDRNATRICSAEGVWEQPYVRECLTCPREANTTLGSGVTLTWPPTIAGETSVISCPKTDRNATRICSAEGVWEQPYIRECLTCPREANTTLGSGVTLTWPSTIAGETSVISCPDGDGNAIRNCTVEAVWEQPYVDNCICTEETKTTSGITLTWFLTPAGGTSVISCPKTDRNATRICSAEGVWEQPYVQECLTCPREANTTSGVTLTWPPTIAGETSSLSCPNTNGDATRNCSVEGVWEQPFVCDCLTQGISQQLCNNPGDTVSVLMNISTSDGDLTTEDVETITETLESVISDSSNLQSIESRQALIDVVEELVNVEREDGGFEKIVTNSLNALVDNTPVVSGGTATITGSGNIVEITVSRPTVDTLRNNGVQVESRGTTVNLPPGLAMQIFGSGLGGGNARASVTTFSYDDGAFQPKDPLSSLGTELVGILLLNQTGIVPVSKLDRDNRVMFQLQRKLFTGGTQTCSFWDVTVSDWSSDGCEVISVTGISVTCACNHLTIFGSLVTLAPSTTPITTLAVALITVGVIVAVGLIVAGVVTLTIICCCYRRKKKKVSFVKESGSENVALSTIRENIYVVKD